MFISYFVLLSVTVSLLTSYSKMQIWKSNIFRTICLRIYYVFTVTLFSLLTVSYWLLVCLSFCTAAVFMDSLSLLNIKLWCLFIYCYAFYDHLRGLFWSCDLFYIKFVFQKNILLISKCWKLCIKSLDKLFSVCFCCLFYKAWYIY